MSEARLFGSFVADSTSSIWQERVLSRNGEACSTTRPGGWRHWKISVSSNTLPSPRARSYDPARRASAAERREACAVKERWIYWSN